MKEWCPTCLRHGVLIEGRPADRPSARESKYGHVTVLVPTRCLRCGSRWHVEHILRDYEAGEPPEETDRGRAILAAMERHGHANRPGWPRDYSMVGDVIRSALVDLGVLPDASEARVQVRYLAVDLRVGDDTVATYPFTAMATPVDWYMGVVIFFEKALQADESEVTLSGQLDTS